MSFQLVSDVHLELGRASLFSERAIRRVAPILILAGDIGDACSLAYRRFLELQSRTFEHVIVVLGNHEYFHNQASKTLAAARAVAKTLPNVHVLEKECVVVNDVTFAGTTLWSRCSRASFSRSSDSRCIRGWTFEAALAEHAACVRWLSHTLDMSAEKVVVISHHAPMHGLGPPRFMHTDDSSYSTDLEELVRHPKVGMWVHGHTHWPHITKIGDTIVASNACGVRSDTKDERFLQFDPDRVFSLSEWT